jgi:hypothetical protein
MGFSLCYAYHTWLTFASFLRLNERILTHSLTHVLCPPCELAGWEHVQRRREYLSKPSVCQEGEVIQRALLHLHPHFYISIHNSTDPAQICGRIREGDAAEDLPSSSPL